MKDIVIEKNLKKVKENFENLKETRKKIIKEGSKKELPQTYPLNQVAKRLHCQNLEVQVSKIVLESSKAKSFYLVPKNKEKLPNFRPGSYITLHVKVFDKTYTRPYHISSLTDKNEYRITIFQDGNGTVSSNMLKSCQEGDTFTLSGPFGNFYYSPIRDTNDVILICRGRGITAIYPILQDLVLNKKIHSVVLLYEAKTKQDILWKEEIDALSKKHNHLKVEYILSEEKRDDFTYGSVSEETLLKYEVMGKTIFVCGTLKMYETLNEIFKKLNIPNKYIRHESYVNRLTDLSHIEHTLTIKTSTEEKKIKCYENETLWKSMENSGVKIPVRCTVGECGFCRSKLVNGKVKTEHDYLREKDKELQFIHPCVTYPLSDVTILLPY